MQRRAAESARDEALAKVAELERRQPHDEGGGADAPDFGATQAQARSNFCNQKHFHAYFTECSCQESSSAESENEGREPTQLTAQRDETQNQAQIQLLHPLSF